MSAFFKHWTSEVSVPWLVAAGFMLSSSFCLSALGSRSASGFQGFLCQFHSLPVQRLRHENRKVV